MFYTITCLRGLPDSRETVASRIDDKDRVMGWDSKGDRDYRLLWQNGKVARLRRPHSRREYLFHDGRWVDLGVLGRGKYAVVMNNKGQFVAEQEVDPGSGTQRPIKRLFVGEKGRLRALRLPPGSFDAWVTDINDKGQIIGTVVIRGESRALLWENDDVRDLGGFSGWPSTYALSINNKGQIVGYVADSHIDPYRQRAFLWNNGVMINLGYTYAHGQEVGSAHAINDHGQIVGRMPAFLWEKDTRFDLNSLIPPNSGWVLDQAKDINNRGKIVGTGKYKGELRPFLLTPERA